MLLLTATQLSAQEQQYELPKEEDESLTEVTEYTFNPLQASKEFKVGEFYRKKGNWQAAAGRYEEATKWNPGYAEAYFKLGQAKERVAESERQEVEQSLRLEAARAAYEKYLELQPEGKNSKTARKRLNDLKEKLAQTSSG